MNADSLPVDRVPHGSCDDPDVLDFSANVNPRRPSGVSRVYSAALSTARTYPADDYCAYRVSAGEYVGCDPADVVPTPGGLAAIRLAVGISVGPGDSALVPTPSFGEYAREVEIAGGDPAFVPHDELLDADPEPHALAIVCNPNNPTGETYSPCALRAFADRCRAAGTTLLVDEAFLGFTDDDTLAGTDGVIVARSLTKLFGLPGLRAGFAVATDSLGERLSSARRPWNLGTPAAAVGEYCMQQDEFVAETRERVRRERVRLRDALDDRFRVSPSDSPFLLVDVSPLSVCEVAGGLRDRGIVVRDATSFRGLDSHVRIAVRSERENDRLLDALADV